MLAGAIDHPQTQRRQLPSPGGSALRMLSEDLVHPRPAKRAWGCEASGWGATLRDPEGTSPAQLIEKTGTLEVSFGTADVQKSLKAPQNFHQNIFGEDESRTLVSQKQWDQIHHPEVRLHNFLREVEEECCSAPPLSWPHLHGAVGRVL